MVNKADFILSLYIALLQSTFISAVDYKNVYGDELQSCSSDGTALTGYTRTGFCVDENDDQGSHHICIDLSSASGGNFCDVTGQDDWCSSEMPCHDDQNEYCQVQQWCVCQWAFASYLENAGGCDNIQTVACESINIEAVFAYQQKQNVASKYKNALECLVERCGLDTSSSIYKTGGTNGMTLPWLGWGLVLIAAATLTWYFVSNRQQKYSDNDKGTHLVEKQLDSALQ